MKLLIVGATGPTGRQMVDQALSQGHAVTALVREPAKANLPAAANKVTGDVLDADSLKKAVVDQEAVLCALGSGATGPFKEMTMLSEGTRHLVAAMQAAGVRRLVCITGVGAGNSKGHGPWYYNWLIQPLLLRGVYHDKDRQEAVVRSSGLDWTLVRPGILTNDPAKSVAAVRAFAELAGVYAGSISRADVAAWCLRELADGRYQGQAPIIIW